MQDCIFCKILAKEIPSTAVYEDERAYAFVDINPQAPTHIVVIPKEHMANFLACADRNDGLMGHLMGVVAKVARQQGLDEKGFRVVTNCGEHAAQSVHHFHVHLIGGAQLSGRMG